MKRLPLVVSCVAAVFALAGCEVPLNPLFIGVIDRLVPDVVYVDAAAPAGGDGLSWETSFRYLADAIQHVEEVRYWDIAVPEIHVAQGVYYPNDADNPDSLVLGGDPVTSFLAHDGVHIYGGYPSGGGVRDPVANVTVLSGDIDGNDTVGPTGITENATDIVGTNAECVMYINGEGAIVDGFTITAAAGWSASGGRAVKGEDSSGLSVQYKNVSFQGNDCGSVLSLEATNDGVLQATLEEVAFRNNAATEMVKVDIYKTSTTGSCEVRLVNVSFTDNGGRAVTISTVDGGSSAIVCTGALFRNNVTPDGGGAVFAFAGDGIGADGSVDMTMVNALFEGNQSASAGGGVYFRGTAGGQNTLRLYNCAFIGNTVSAGNGGAVTVSGPATAHVVNSTFTANQASADGGGLYLSSAVATLSNAIMWSDAAGGSGAEVMLASGATATVTASDVQGSNGSGGSWDVAVGTDGGGNIDGDPTFKTVPSAGDGDWTTTGDNNYGDLSLQGGSPAGNAGQTGLLPADAWDLDDDGNMSEVLPVDISGSPRVIAPSVDMGAYESL